MGKQCSNCGRMNEDYQNFCVECGNALTQQVNQSQEPVQGYVPVANQAPQASQDQPANTWQEAQTPPPTGTWQAPQTPQPTGTWQSPPPGQYYQSYQGPQPQRGPVYGGGQVRSEFEESKGLFLSMINAHKADADPAMQKGEIPPRKYPALKLFMTIQRILAWIIAGGILLSGIIAFISLIGNRYTWWGGLLALPVSVLAAFLSLAANYALIDFVRLLINTEDNTRRAANK
ncbi:MAG TPA: zinc-ribbon domain-containing protein [Anaerolineaceae bacterium]|jgi:predicted  nucleic acid-binding Zn-ribbon protein|nr:zinc-ribbon domain-containing protein [Anaerolineaceae bacterium]